MESIIDIDVCNLNKTIITANITKWERISGLKSNL